MKKKLVSLLLVLALVIGVTVISAMAEEATDVPEVPETQEYKYCKCGGYLDADVATAIKHSHSELKFTPLTQDVVKALTITEADEMGGDSYTLTTGNYVLTEDITADKSLLIPKNNTVNLNLNGHTLNCTDSVTYAIVARGSFNISDSSYDPADANAQSGKLMGSSNPTKGGSAMYVCSTANVFLYSGEIRCGTEQDTVSGPLAVGGKMHICGGQVVGYKTTGSGGAIVINDSGNLTVWGGKVVAGEAKNGAAIYTTYKAKKNPKITIRCEGIVTSGKATNLADCIYAVNAVSVEDNAQVGGVYLHSDANCTATLTTKNLTGKVGVEIATNGFREIGTSTEADFANLISLMPGNHHLVYNEGKIAFVNHVDHCVCGGNLTGVAAENHTCSETAPTWTALTADNIDQYLSNSTRADSTYKMFAESGYYYLAGDIDIALPIEILQGQQISICLNGYKLTHTAKKGSILRACGGTLNISDCTGEGVIQSNHSTTGPTLYILNGYSDETEGVTVNLFGGNLIAKDSNWGNAAGVVQVGNNSSRPCTFNVYGGTISGGKAYAGGNVYVDRGTMNMYGGIIADGNVRSNSTGQPPAIKDIANRGGNVFVNNGKFYMYGGVIQNGTTNSEYFNKNLATEPNPAYGNDLYLHNGTNAAVKLDCAVGDLNVAVEGTKKIALGSNFVSTGIITCDIVAEDGAVLTGAKYNMLPNFAAQKADAYQLTCEGGSICLRDVALDYHCRCGGNMTEAAKKYMKHTNCSDILWTDLTQAMIDGLEVKTGDSVGDTLSILPAGNYKLVEDITTTYTLTVDLDTEVKLDLNGHTLTGAETAKRAVYAKGNLNISDSTYDPADENAVWGKIVGSNTKNGGHSLYVGASSDTRLYGGEIASAFTEASVGGPVAISGKFHMAGGKITGLTKTSANGGAIILNDNANVTLWGGIVQGGEAVRGGAIYVSKATQFLSIRGDAQIIGGSAKQGGNIYALGNVSIDEEAVISGGIAFSGTIDKKSVGGGGNIYSEASVYVKGGQIIGGQATRENSEPAYGGNIYQNKAGAAKIVQITGGVVADGTAATGGNIFCRSSFEMTAGTVSGGVATSAMAGNIRLEGNATANPTINITGGEIKDGVSYQQGANLVIRNSTANVVIKNASFLNGNCTSHHGGNVYITGQIGSVEMENVTISDGKAFNRAGNLYIVGSADLEVAPVVTLTNCVITNGVSGSRGGNIYLADVNATLNNCTVTGGSIVEGTDTDPFNMYGYNLATNYGNYETYITINGGTYTGAGENNLSASGVHILSGDTLCQMSLVGAPVIDNLRIGTNRMINVDGLTEGASIGVSRFEITGLFAPGATADKLAYFHATLEGTSVSHAEEGLRLDSEYAYWAYTAAHKGLGGAATIEEAMAIPGAAMIKMTQDHTTEEVIPADTSVYLDLNGYDLSGLTVNGNLYVVDYATNNFEEDVYGKLTCTVGEGGKINDGKTLLNAKATGMFNTNNGYVMVVEEDGSYTFHAILGKIVYISLNPAADALGYKAQLSGDSKALAAVSEFGMNLYVSSDRINTYTKALKDDRMFTLRLQNIMKNNGGEMTIYGAPVIKVDDQTMSFPTTTTSMKDTIEAVNDLSNLNDEQKAAVYEFYKQYESVMSVWKNKDGASIVANIKKWAPKAA